METDEQLTCIFCNAKFKTDKGYNKHSCEIKKKLGDLSEDKVHYAHYIFNFWFRLNIKTNRLGNGKTFRQFTMSPYMAEFCRVYYEIVMVRKMNPYTFVLWAKEEGVNTTRWLSVDSLEAFEGEYPRLADPLIHTTETIEAMMISGEEYEIELVDFFKKSKIEEIMIMIEHGYISPWVLLLSNNANNFLSRLKKNEIKHLDYIIDLGYWDKRIQDNPDDAQTVKDILSEFNID